MKPGTKVKLKDGRVGIINAVGEKDVANINMNTTGLGADGTTGMDVVYAKLSELEELKEDTPPAPVEPTPPAEPVEPIGEPATA